MKAAAALALGFALGTVYAGAIPTGIYTPEEARYTALAEELLWRGTG